MAPKRFQQPGPFSYLGVPAPAGISDYYELHRPKRID